MLKRIKIVAAAAALFAALGAVVPATASAATAAPAAGCSGYGCDGQWPDLAGCANTAITPSGFSVPIKQGNATIGYIELRYSTSCHTAWARVRSYYYNYNGKSTPSEFASITRHSDNQSYGCDSDNWSSTVGTYSCYTQMVYDGGEYARAFGVSPNWYGSTSNAFTRWY